MPSKVIGDPAAIEQFAYQLKAYNDALRDQSSKLRAQFNRLGELWRDQEHKKFAEQFQQAMREIEHYLRASNQHIPFLHRKAQRLREYLQQG